MDATHSAGFGRMINDDHKKPNCKVVVEDNDGRPSLTIYSIRQITKGEEICFNYQDSSVPWRKVCINKVDILSRHSKTF
jgi:SET domain-containing protein